MSAKTAIRRRTPISRPVPPVEWWRAEKFTKYFKQRGRDECWLWTGAKSDGGYGRFKIDGKLYSAHRVAYVMANGPIPAGYGFHGAIVMHSCDNPSCVNPAHLSVGSHSDNMQDMRRKGRGNGQLKDETGTKLATVDGAKLATENLPQRTMKKKQGLTGAQGVNRTPDTAIFSRVFTHVTR